MEDIVAEERSVTTHPDVSELVLQNCVVHFQIERDLCKRVVNRVEGGGKDCMVKKCGNFYVIRWRTKNQRRRRPSFTFFPASGHVIGTGIIGGEDQFPIALETFARTGGIWSHVFTFSQQQQEQPWWRRWKPRVVNSTYTGWLRGGDGKTYACKTLAENFRAAAAATAAAAAAAAPVGVDKDKRRVQVSFRSQFFPGARIHWRDLGTINLFNNGKYVIVGVKNEHEALQARERLCHLLSIPTSVPLSRDTTSAPTA